MRSSVTAIVPCHNGGSTVGITVKTLLATGKVDDVLVVDDGSKDDTAAQARIGGAIVVRLANNQGKAGAMKAGISAATDAEIFLFVDADTGETAGEAVALLVPIFDDQADMTVAVFPSAGSQGGFGLVKKVAIWGIYRSAYARVRAPLSGQRAVKADMMRSLVAEHDLAARFGVEVGLTIDALNSGFRLAEVDVQMTHRHRGRGLGGFAHRANQGKDILRAIWYRAAPPWFRLMPLALATAILLLFCGVSAADQQRQDGSSLPHYDEVQVTLIPGGNWENIRVGEQSGPLASVVTGASDNPFATVTAGSRDEKAPPSPDVVVNSAFAVPTNPQVPTIVAAVTGSGDAALLRPIALIGGDITGTLTSPSTQRHGLVDITDIAPTVLAMEGKPIPSTMTGTPMRLTDGASSVTELQAVSDLVRFYDRVNPKVILVFVLFQLLVFIYALYASRSGKELPGANRIAAAVAGFPVVTYLTRWLLGNGVDTVRWLLLSALLLVGVSYLANYRASNALTSLQRVLLLTIGVMSADVLLGSHLQLSGTFGSAPSLGARYHGLGNPATEVLLLASVLWVGMHVQGAISRLDAIWTSAMLLLFVTVVVGAPGLGSDVGGLLVMVLTSSGLLAALIFRRFDWKWIGIAAGGSFLALSVATFFDYRKAADDRTHLGRLIRA